LTPSASRPQSGSRLSHERAICNSLLDRRLLKPTLGEPPHLRATSRRASCIDEWTMHRVGRHRNCRCVQTLPARKDKRQRVKEQ
jgi:hypothetical protein